MLNCIFYSLFFVLFIDLSTGSLRLSQINRIFLSTYKGMYEACVVTVGDDGEEIYPYFNQTLINSHIRTFLDEKLTRYTTNYVLTCDFYNEDGITKCSENDLARCLKINLKANVNFLFKYDKLQTYSIKDKNNL